MRIALGSLLFALAALAALGSVAQESAEAVPQGSCRIPPETEIIDLEALRKEQYGDLSTEEFIRQRLLEAEFDEDGHPFFEEFPDVAPEEAVDEQSSIKDANEEL